MHVRVTLWANRLQDLLRVRTFVGCGLLWAASVVLGAVSAIVGLDSVAGMLVLICAFSIGFLSVLLLVELRIARLIERTYGSSSMRVKESSSPRGLRGVSVPGSVKQLEGSQYSPAFCRAINRPSPGVGKSERMMIGRGDSVLEGDGQSDTRLLALLNQTTKTPARPEVALVGSLVEEQWLSSKSSVTRVRPGLSRVELSPSAAYFVISTRVNDVGPWAGVLDSSNFALFDQLRRASAEAKGNGTVVVVLDIPNRSVSHFAGSVRTLADVVVAPGLEFDAGSGGGNRMLHHLWQLVEKEA